MSLIDTLTALAITVRNEKKREANSAIRIGDLFLAIIDFIKGITTGQIRQEGVDTYNDNSGGKTSLLNTYPNPETGWTVLVRNDETNEGKASLYQWNGTRWINLETVVYNDGVISKDDIYNYSSVPNTLSNYPFTLESARQYPDLAKCIVDLKVTKGILVKPYVFGVSINENKELTSIHIYENGSLVLHGGENIPSEKIGNITYYQLFQYNESGYEGYIGIDLDRAINQSFAEAYLSPLCWDDNYKNLYELYKNLQIKDSRFIYMHTDNQGKILLGHKDNGEFYCYNLDKYIAQIFGFDNTLELSDTLNVVTFADNHKYVFCFCDAENKILFAILKDGTIYKYGEKEESEDINKLNYSNSTSASVPFPTTVSKVYIASNRMDELNESKNAVRATIELITEGGYFKKPCDIAWQGSSSIQDPKKNYGIDLLNDDDSSFKLRIGNLRYFDSFHLKAYYQDKNRMRNNVSARLVEQVDLSRSMGNQRAWDYLPKTKTKDYIDTGARGHIEGFPCEMYINGEFAGLYYWNLKKHRDNYNQEKSNPKHLRLEWSHGDFSLPIRWDRIEISNPNSFDAFTEPPAGEVKTYIVNFWNAINNASSKQDLESIMNIPFWIDYYILFQFMYAADNSRQNIQICSWDGIKWAALWYDMDVTFAAWQTSPTALIPRTVQNGDDWEGLNLALYKTVKYYAPEISARYIELRDSGILTYKNIESLFRNEERLIGIDLLKKEFDKWGYGELNANSTVTQIMQWMQKRIPVVDNYFTQTILTEVLS